MGEEERRAVVCDYDLEAHARLRSGVGRNPAKIGTEHFCGAAGASARFIVAVPSHHGILGTLQ